MGDHTGYPEITNVTEQSEGVKYLSGNNLPRINLIRGKLFPDRYNTPIPSHPGWNKVGDGASRTQIRTDRTE